MPQARRRMEISGIEEPQGMFMKTLGSKLRKIKKCNMLRGCV
jgi:hypothetical protein